MVFRISADLQERTSHHRCESAGCADHRVKVFSGTDVTNIAPAALHKLRDKVLARSRDDYVGLWVVIKQLDEEYGVPGDALREQTLEVVRELLKLGLLAGDPPYSVTGYGPWQDQRPDAVIERIRAEWIALGRTPSIPDTVWFSTPN